MAVVRGVENVVLMIDDQQQQQDGDEFNNGDVDECFIYHCRT